MMAQFSAVGIDFWRGSPLLCRWRVAGLLGAVIAAALAATGTQSAEASSIFAISFSGSSRPVFSCEETDRSDGAGSRPANGALPTDQALNTLAVERAASQNFISPAGKNVVKTTPPAFKLRRWRTDRAVIVATIYEAGWLAADGITTARIHGGAVESGSVWAYGKHPTAGRVSAMMAAEFMGVETSSYLLHKMRAPRWIYMAPMIGSGSLHASGAINNIRKGQ